MTQKIACIAEFTAKEGMADSLMKELAQLVPLTRQEAGCISYALHVSLDNPNNMTMIESFQNKAAFDFHSSTTYIKRFAQEVLPTLVEAVQVKLYKEVLT